MVTSRQDRRHLHRPTVQHGAKDWKYNNDYVEGDDLYRHSKWLAFVERRLLLAKELLNPDNSVLIVTIDEKEYLRLGLLLDQVFQGAAIQMATTVINHSGVARGRQFSRSDEYIFFVLVGAASVVPTGEDMLNAREEDAGKKVDLWRRLLRSGTNARRQDGPNLFYPFWIDPKAACIDSVGDAIPVNAAAAAVKSPRPGLVACWPIRLDDSEGNWQAGGQVSLRAARVTANAAAQAGVALTVEDTGPGVPAEFLPRAFEPYAINGSPGAGMGLAIVRGIMELHGVTATLTSAPALGTRVLLAFPDGVDPGGAARPIRDSDNTVIGRTAS